MFSIGGSYVGIDRCCRSDGNDFAELLWENGQAVVHGRISRKQQQPHTTTSFPPFTYGSGSSSRAQEKQQQPGGGDPVALFKTGAGGGLFGAGGLAPSLHDFASGLDATRDNNNNGDLDDTVPWIHYPIIEEEEEEPAAPALADTYSPDFFSELHAAAAAAANLGSLPPAVQHTPNSNRSNPTMATTTSREPEHSKESHRIPIPGPATRAEPPQPELFTATKQQPRLGGGSSGEGLMNFALFSRPAAMARASLQMSAQQRPPPSQAAAAGTDKASNVTTSTRVESTVLQSSSGARTAPAPVFADQIRTAAWSQQPKEVRFSTCTAAAPPPASGNNLQQEMPRDRLGSNMSLQKKVETRKAPEATSSVCSGNGAGIGNNDESWRQHKRKSAQAECSASQDDDIEDESAGMRRSGSRGTKRSRTAEVHNLSERRRRDRINEKMRALQELIPNCNKARLAHSIILLPHLSLGP
nr:unnamed protein product [Digitaria exilis]